MLAKNQGTSRADARCCNVASSAITAVEAGREMRPEERRREDDSLVEVLSRTRALRRIWDG
jgi:hypothetical protein